MRTVEQAMRWLKGRGAATLSDLVEAVAGAPVRGSWWAHPKGRLIFRLGEALGDSSDVLVCKLAAGKVTFVHRRLFAALHRVAADPARRAAALETLGPRSRRLLADARRQGGLRLDAWAGRARVPLPAAKLALAELERSLLVRSEQEHTERGSHATRVEPWERWARPAVRRAAARLSLEQARAALEGIESFKA